MAQVPKYWHYPELTKAQTPRFDDGEQVSEIIDHVGLYQGDFKVKNRQDGRVYLTTKRVIYVDNLDTLNYSLCVYLADVSKLSFYTGFLKSSPKLTVCFKDDLVQVNENKVEMSLDRNSDSSTDLKGADAFEEIVMWKCKICFFQNSISSRDYELNNMINENLNSIMQFPTCSNCGVKSNKKSIINAIKRSRQKKIQKLKQDAMELAAKTHGKDFSTLEKPDTDKRVCTVCTFENHKLMQICEVCGANLLKSGGAVDNKKENTEVILMQSEDNSNEKAFSANYMKLSFRDKSLSANQLKNFVQVFQKLLDDVKYDEIVQKSNNNVNVAKIVMPSSKVKTEQKHGITALVETQGTVIEKNEKILESSLNDLNSLMNKAQELSKLIKSFDKIVLNDSDANKKYRDTLTQSKQTLGIQDNKSLNQIALKNNFNFLNKLDNKELFYKELARNLSMFLLEYVFTESENGNMISLLDLYSLYNRSLGFNNNLISPSDLLESVRLFEKLKLPIKFRKFEKSGLMVIQDLKADDQAILNSVFELLIKEKFSNNTASKSFVGLNLQVLCNKFNFSFEIMKEVLEIGLNDGLLTVDEHITGSNYYLNEMVEFVI